MEQSRTDLMVEAINIAQSVIAEEIPEIERYNHFIRDPVISNHSGSIGMVEDHLRKNRDRNDDSWNIYGQIESLHRVGQFTDWARAPVTAKPLSESEMEARELARGLENLNIANMETTNNEERVPYSGGGVPRLLPSYSEFMRGREIG